ncbi:MAG: hypothetical protein RLY70_362, partial [Planctomycetota bacterium]
DYESPALTIELQARDIRISSCSALLCKVNGELCWHESQSLSAVWASVLDYGGRHGTAVRRQRSSNWEPPWRLGFGRPLPLRWTTVWSTTLALSLSDRPTPASADPRWRPVRGRIGRHQTQAHCRRQLRGPLRVSMANSHEASLAGWLAAWRGVWRLATLREALWARAQNASGDTFTVAAA